MWIQLRLATARLWRWARMSGAERRIARRQAHYWAELREGEREAESRTRP